MRGNKNSHGWHLWKSVHPFLTMFLMVGLLAACGGSSSAHLHTHNPGEKQPRSDNATDIQRFERVIVYSQKQHLLQLSLLHDQANELLKRFHQEVARWGNVHRYYDPYNGVSYKLDYEYDQGQGSGTDADYAVTHAHTASDYRAAIAQVATSLTHLQAMEATNADKTFWNMPHASDLKLIHYHHLTGKVIIVSFLEQACRVYQNGKLIKAFLITSGRFSNPSPSGLWHIFQRQSPTIFRSYAPAWSSAWYPDTPINYAMQYREGGYYLHDSWWRAYYGPGTNFPHYDPTGQRFAGDGSHGCINLPPYAAAWLYSSTAYGTPVITY